MHSYAIAITITIKISIKILKYFTYSIIFFTNLYFFLNIYVAIQGTSNTTINFFYKNYTFIHPKGLKNKQNLVKYDGFSI